MTSDARPLLVLRRGSLRKSLMAFGNSIPKREAIDHIARICTAIDDKRASRKVWRKRVDSAVSYACRTQVFDKRKTRLPTGTLIEWAARKWPQLQEALDCVPMRPPGKIVSAGAVRLISEANVEARPAPTINITLSRQEALEVALRLNADAAAAELQRDRLLAENRELRVFKQRKDDQAKRQREGAREAGRRRKRSTGS